MWLKGMQVLVGVGIEQKAPKSGSMGYGCAYQSPEVSTHGKWPTHKAMQAAKGSACELDCKEHH